MNYFFYILLGLTIVYVEFTRRKYFKIDHLTLFHGFFFLVYSFTPIAILLIGDEAVADDLVYGKYYLDKNPYIGALIYGSYLLFLVGYYWQYPRSFFKNIEFKLMLHQNTIMSMMPFLYIGIIGLLLLYIVSNGGLREAIQNAELIRGGELEPKYGFIVRLLKINILLMYYFFFKVFLERDRSFWIEKIIFFSISFAVFSTHAALINSRGFILLTLVGLYVITVIYHNKLFLKFAIGAIIIGMLFIKYGDPLFRSMPDLVNYDFDTFVNTFKEKMAIRDSRDGNIIANFAHPIVSLNLSLNVAGVTEDFRYIMDYIYAIMGLIPNSIASFDDPKNVSVLNTQLVFGEEVAQTLPGILALFAYAYSIVGVLLGMFLYGVFGGMLSEFFKTVYEKYPGYLAFIYMISLTYGYFVFRGYPTVALNSQFMVIVANIFLLMFSRIYIKKRGVAY